jgi:uncharacterized membrane protein|tara:strand:- start:95 stop:424 length:330 start_codon:yes stop_codon:yes gene_type:complete
MLNKNLKAFTNALTILLIFTKFLTVVAGRTEIYFFIFWSLPFLIFISFANNLSIKSYQSFAFILLIYFMSASLRVFGITPYIFDLLELLLIVVFFILCIFAPRNIRKNM